MNYTPSASGGGITQLQYREIDLTGSDFTKLNTTPLTVLQNNGYTIIPVSTTVSYSCSNGLGGIPILIGFENLLVNYLTGCWYSVPVTADQNIFSSQYDFSTGGSTLSNIEFTHDLILWQNTDDNSLNFSYFKINILYLQVTNLP